MVPNGHGKTIDANVVVIAQLDTTKDESQGNTVPYHAFVELDYCHTMLLEECKNGLVALDEVAMWNFEVASIQNILEDLNVMEE